MASKAKIDFSEVFTEIKKVKVEIAVLKEPLLTDADDESDGQIPSHAFALIVVPGKMEYMFGNVANFQVDLKYDSDDVYNGYGAKILSSHFTTHAEVSFIAQQFGDSKSCGVVYAAQQTEKHMYVGLKAYLDKPEGRELRNWMLKVLGLL